MKKLIFLFLMFLMLIGAAGGSLRFLEIGPFKPKKGEVRKTFRKQEKDTTIFIDMDPLAIPIFQGNKVAAIIQIQVKLETNNNRNAETIRDRMPVITDAFVRDLHSFMPRLLKAKERVDVLIIKQRLQMVANRVAGKDLIKNVLVQSVLDQPH